MPHSTYTKLSELPDTIPIFPIAGVLLLPRWQLPLNIFEPRYLNMFDDAMATHKLIGMIQSVGGDRAQPDIAAVGCLGEITSYSETDDGRYLVTLTGAIRYGVEIEIDQAKPYREVQPNYMPFADDFNLPDTFATPTHQMVIDALKLYAESKGLETDWQTVADAEMEILVSALSAGCPFDGMERQALLEATDLQTRADILIQLMKLNTPQTNGGSRLQ